MNTKPRNTAKSLRAGALARLGALLRGLGSSAPTGGPRVLFACAALATALLLTVAPAQAATPGAWWHLDLGSRPTNLAPESTGEVVAFIQNAGYAPATGETTPISVTDTLPSGLRPLALYARVNIGNDPRAERSLSCELATLTCSYDHLVPAFVQIELRVSVEVLPGAGSAEENEVSVSGGGAEAASLARPLRISPDPTPFGLEEYDFRTEEVGGGLAAGAASHPFQTTGTVVLDQGPDTNPPPGSPANLPAVMPIALPRNVETVLPPGFLGDPTPFPTCNLALFSLINSTGPGNNENGCPASTVVGIATVQSEESGFVGNLGFTVPIFALEPAYGEPARFGFTVPLANVTVVLDTSLRSARGPHGEPPDYGITISSLNTTAKAALLSAEVTFWGVPGDPRHNADRGWACLNRSTGITEEACSAPPAEENPPALLTMPASCAGPLRSSIEIDSWEHPGSFSDFPTTDPLQTLAACNRVPFAPTVHAEPTSDSATTGTGFNFGLNFQNEGLTNSNEGALAESEVKKAVVTLPEGFTSNPSVAAGLKACTEAEYEASTDQPGTGCTEESKIGEVELESPLVRPKEPITGSLFVARQKENPNHNLLTLYMVIQSPELGIMIKQPMKVVPDPVTGQLTTEVDDIPQLPFSHFRLKFRSGQRSPLITPPACGTYTTKALLYPWSDPSEPVEESSSFQITGGPEGQGCPSGGTPPFHPTLEAGTTNNAAGTYSPFYARISRKDSEQEITHFSIKLPPGVVGKLAGVGQCSDAAIAQAKSLERVLGGGQEEEEHPSCPAGSEIGHTTVGTGVGNVLAYAPGKLYLAGPYNGSNLSIVSITAAKVGPFDLGTVVVREALKVNPETAVVSAEAAGSDAIPHIVDGIPVHLRDIRIYVDRPNFVLNPTSCERFSTASTVLGSGTNFASEADDVPVTVTSPFQASSCASLAFKPKLALSLKGPTRRAGLPALKAVVSFPKGTSSANIAKTVVTLPPSEFLEQAHIGSSCTRVQFNEGGGNGEHCPANSLLGHATAITPLLEEPIEGPVYLRSNGGERKLPDLVAALHSKDINVNLVGFISSLHKKGSEVSQIRNTFAAVPDAPVSKFTLELFGGKKGLLVNSTNICKGTHRAISAFTGQNGKLYDTNPKVTAQCGKKGKKHKRHGKKSGGKKK